MAAVLDVARRPGLHGLHLQVALTNERARRLYRREGFAQRSGYELLSRTLQARVGYTCPVNLVFVS